MAERSVSDALTRLSERPEIAADVALMAAEVERHDAYVLAKEGQIGRLEARAQAAEAEVERLREAIRWHRLAAEETVGADTTDPEYYEPFDHALWAALRESTPEVPSDG